ncbi:MAG TPA: TonB-dependent receptor plug domain-containing protein, partial [Sphingomicrobium sp.]|nr:TonB-dependent receptor plug domain-containing protein [Sphingomicrobium sp.]
MAFGARQRAFLASGAVALVASAPASAQQRQFNVPAQDARTGIPEFARQAGIQISAPTGHLDNKRTNAVRGSKDVSAALAELIKGTGLVVASNDGRMIVLQLPSAEGNAGAAETGAVGDESVIIVTARKRSERAIDVPIALTTFQGQALEKRGALNVAEVLQEAPGVGAFDYGGAAGTKITIRGISTSLGANENGYYLDDLPFTGVTVPLSPDVRAWDLDRIEVLRGPQGTLFGEGSMGGTIRILT